MKFNEKLIKLRKEQGLSQEELGEKLNVTRQTISKWELGETTPEMSKLLEMANTFGVSVDELTNDTEIVKEGKSVEDESKSTRNIIIIVVLIAVLLGAIYFAVGRIIGDGFKFAKGIFYNSKSQVETMQDQVDQVQKNAEGMFGTVVDVMKQTQAEYDKEKIESEKRSFNLAFELRDGTQWNTTVQQVIDMVIESNQKNDRKISVKYNDTATQDVAELRQMKRNFDSSKKYEIYLEYDNDGYVNQVVIEKI